MDSVAQCRAILSRFTAERPFLVPRTIYAAMLKIPEIADMMDRAAESKPLPLR